MAVYDCRKIKTAFLVLDHAGGCTNLDEQGARTAAGAGAAVRAHLITRGLRGAGS